jgi:hypothetical protein
MGTLTTLGIWYQFGEPTKDCAEACGQNSVASVLVGGGSMPNNAHAPLTIDGWMQAQEARWRNTWPGWRGLAQDGTMPEMLTEAIQTFSPGAKCRNLGSNVNAIADTINAGRFVIPLMTSDSYGRLMAYPGHTGHWIAVFSAESDGYGIANSGTGHTEHHSTGEFRNSFRGIVIDTGIYPHGFDNQGEPLVWDINMKRVAILEVRNLFEPWPADLSSVDVYAAKVKDDGSNLLDVRDGLLKEFRSGNAKTIHERLQAVEAK